MSESNEPRRVIEWHDSIDSTMRRAAAFADEGAVHGSIVVAREQTAGQGRLGRQWHSPLGGLWFTMILRLDLPPQQLPIVTLALGVAVADAIQTFGGLACDLRWPNDVLTQDGRKVAGILAQLHNGVVLAGVGVNVNQAEFPEDLRTIATSIAHETGAFKDIQFMLFAMAGAIDSHCRILATSGSSAILRLFANASSYVSGRRVSVDLPDGPVTGATAGLTEDGYLLLRKDNGDEIRITAGGVRAL